MKVIVLNILKLQQASQLPNSTAQVVGYERASAIMVWHEACQHGMKQSGVAASHELKALGDDEQAQVGHAALLTTFCTPPDLGRRTVALGVSISNTALCARVAHQLVA
jgi:hypothetical protein